MSALVNTRNEQEEKVQSNIEDNADQINTAFLDQYNKEIDQTDAEVEAGNYVSRNDVKQLFQKRRKPFTR